MSITNTKIFNGVSWVDPEDILVYNGISWESVQAVKVFNGISWDTVWEPGGTPPTPMTLPATTVFTIRYWDGSNYIDDFIGTTFGGNTVFPFNGQDIVTDANVVFVDQTVTTANVVGTTFPWQDVDWNKRHYYNAKLYIGGSVVYDGAYVNRDAVGDENASITITSVIPTYGDIYNPTGADIFTHSGNGTKEITVVIEAEYIVNSAPWTWEYTLSSGNIYLDLP